MSTVIDYIGTKISLGNSIGNASSLFFLLCTNTYCFCFLPTFLGESLYVYCRTPAVPIKSVILLCHSSLVTCKFAILGLLVPHLLAYRHLRAVSGHPTSSKRVQENPSSVCSVYSDPLLLNKPSSFGKQPQKPSGPGSKTFSLG